MISKPNTTTARACRSIRKSSPAGSARPRPIASGCRPEENAELGLAYGSGARQHVDLFFPDTTGHTPLALFIHGGYWRSLEPSTFSHMSAGLNARGIAVAVAGYELCPQVTILQIIEQIRTACLFLWRRFGQRLMVYGHSAGGHLAACMVATDWRKLDPKAPSDLVPAGYSVSGVFDLKPLIAHRDERRLQAHRGRAPRRCRRCGGRCRAGTRSTRWSVAPSSSEFLRQSRKVVDDWRQRGVETRYEEVPGANHFTVLDPLSDPASAMTARCAALAARCAKVDK